MIDEERTFEIFGYISTDLTKNSRKVVVQCDICKKERIIRYSDYQADRDLCKSCSLKQFYNLQRGPFNINYFELVQKYIENGDINESRTFTEFGYYSIDLSYGSNRLVWSICRKCNKERLLKYSVHNRASKVCKPCALSGKNNPMYGKHLSEETRQKISKSNTGLHCGKDNGMYGKYPSEETRRKISERTSGKNNPMYGKTGIKSPLYKGGRELAKARRKAKCQELAKSQPKKENTWCGQHHTYESRCRMSASQQGISYNEWEFFAINQPYCPLFNESCKESNREKYGRVCFICGKPEIENKTYTGKYRKLSVHHVDMNKNQGCNGHEWKLIPVCMQCHTKLHNKRMISCIEYILNIENVEKST